MTPDTITVDGVQYVRAYHVADGKCVACGFARGVWTAPLVVAAIQAWHVKYGRTPRADDWRNGSEPDRPTLTTVLGLFGTWNRAMEAAGFTGRKIGGNRRWTRTAILAAFQEWARTHNGTPPTCDEWETAVGHNPPSSTVVRHFGSWNAAIDAAGFYPRGSWGHRVRGKIDPRELIGKVDAAPIAEVIRAEVAAGATLPNLAHEIGVDVTYLAKILRAEKETIRADYADRILVALDRPHVFAEAAA